MIFFFSLEKYTKEEKCLITSLCEIKFPRCWNAWEFKIPPTNNLPWFVFIVKVSLFINFPFAFPCAHATINKENEKRSHHHWGRRNRKRKRGKIINFLSLHLTMWKSKVMRGEEKWGKPVKRFSRFFVVCEKTRKIIFLRCANKLILISASSRKKVFCALDGGQREWRCHVFSLLFFTRRCFISNFRFLWLVSTTIKEAEMCIKVYMGRQTVYFHFVYLIFLNVWQFIIIEIRWDNYFLWKWRTRIFTFSRENLFFQIFVCLHRWSFALFISDLLFFPPRKNEI